MCRACNSALLLVRDKFQILRVGRIDSFGELGMVNGVNTTSPAYVASIGNTTDSTVATPRVSIVSAAAV